MIPKTIVLEHVQNKLDREELMVFNEAKRLGINTILKTTKQLSRNQFVMTPDMMAVGGATFMKHALRLLGKKLPEHNPYPEVLKHLLYREVRQLANLHTAKRMLDEQSLFVKPAGWKQFTGFVPVGSDDYRFNGASNWIPVWISEPVKFVSEWRVYVAADVILDVRFCDHGGDREVKPNMDVITGAIMALSIWGAPQGYVIDFGVLSTGETALVEMNDGFSFGAYDGLPAETLWVVLLNRWNELIRKNDEQDGSNRIAAGHEAVGAAIGQELGVARFLRQPHIDAQQGDHPHRDSAV